MKLIYFSTKKCNKKKYWCIIIVLFKKNEKNYKSPHIFFYDGQECGNFSKRNNITKFLYQNELNTRKKERIFFVIAERKTSTFLIFLYFFNFLLIVIS